MNKIIKVDFKSLSKKKEEQLEKSPLKTFPYWFIIALMVGISVFGILSFGQTPPTPETKTMTLYNLYINKWNIDLSKVATICEMGCNKMYSECNEVVSSLFDKKSVSVRQKACNNIAARCFFKCEKL